MEHKRVAVVFGERDGIKIGHSLLAVNGAKVRIESGKAVLENDSKDVFEVSCIVCTFTAVFIVPSNKVLKELLPNLSACFDNWQFPEGISRFLQHLFLPSVAYN